ncbi:hypothetical protein ILYODFUR_019153 [Ilyodon furcidens]|uniref:Uncharacterized protein n=1 Tax=Ilyodon furcidens TaxID=33524 RepID=A0ABV0SQZ8_9TELE
MSSQQQKYRNFSTDSLGRDRMPSDDGYYQGMLKATDGRKDERDRVQKKTFTKWINKHLIKVRSCSPFRSLNTYCKPHLCTHVLSFRFIKEEIN